MLYIHVNDVSLLFIIWLMHWQFMLVFLKTHIKYF